MARKWHKFLIAAVAKGEMAALSKLITDADLYVHLEMDLDLKSFNAFCLSTTDSCSFFSLHFYFLISRNKS